MSIKTILKRAVPDFFVIFIRKVKNEISLFLSYSYDFKRYVKYSATTRQNNNKKMVGKIIAHYHVIEKGLSFENMKPFFGLDVIRSLVNLINEYISMGYDTSNVQFLTACSVLVKYKNKHIENGYDVGVINQLLNKNIYNYASNYLGGSKIVKKSEILNSIDIDFKSFFYNRYSIRDFSNQEVDIKFILESLEIAKKYPSVCNRQSARVYIVEGRNKIDDYLSYQQGTRGFSDKINKLIIVTSDLSVFENANERNQAYIDGGIYLMGLLLSLHSVGLGSVALNWSKSKEQDKKFRRVCCINDNEVIIALVGVGCLKDEVNVPKSERSSVEDILTVIK